jgi:hypothetical protein
LEGGEDGVGEIDQVYCAVGVDVDHLALS